MKNFNLTVILLGIFCIFSLFTQAHEGHHDQLGLDEAIWAATAEIQRLADEKIIPESWKEYSEFNYDQSAMQSIKGQKRWVIVFDNASEINPAEKTIKISITPQGKFVGYEFVKTP